jgi:hypothetical protein
MIGAIGLGFVSETFTFPALFALWFWLFYPHVIRAEEQRLAGLHGAEIEEISAAGAAVLAATSRGAR